MAIDNYTSYLQYIGNLTSDVMQPNKAINEAGHGEESYNVNDEIDQGIVGTSQQAASGFPDSFDLSLSHFALVFAVENDSGNLALLYFCSVIVKKIVKYAIHYCRWYPRNRTRG